MHSKLRHSHSVRFFTEKQFYIYGLLGFEIVLPGFSGWRSPWWVAPRDIVQVTLLMEVLI